MKNTLRYLLIVALISMASVLRATNVAAQNLAQRPEVQMQSTSVMQGSGSALPQAAITGSYMTGSTPGTYSPTGASGPHRAKKDDANGDGWEDDDDPDKPAEPFPLGDATWFLLALACAYLITVYIRARVKKELVN